MRKHHTSIYSDLRQPLQIAVAAVAAMCGGTFPLVGSPKRVCVPTTNTNTQPVGQFDPKKSHKMSISVPIISIATLLSHTLAHFTGPSFIHAQNPKVPK